MSERSGNAALGCVGAVAVLCASFCITFAMALGVFVAYAVVLR